MTNIAYSHPYTIGGMISVVLFGIIFFKCVWRLTGAALGWYDNQHRFFFHKLVFHGIFSVYALFEVLYAISMIIYDHVSLWGYTFHLVALFLNLILFLILINIWGILLQDVKKTKNAAIVLMTINLSVIMWAVIDMHNTPDYEDFLRSHSYLSMVCANAFAKFSLCILIIIYGYQLRETLHISPNLLVSMTQQEIDIKLLLLRRIKIVLLVFTGCYFCRVTALLVLVLNDNTEGTGVHSLLTMPLLTWYLVAWWIPNIPPNIFFFAMMKLPLSPDQNKNKSSTPGGKVVTNKMFADYDIDPSTRDSFPDHAMESYVEEESRYSNITAGSRLSSAEVEMGRVISAEDMRKKQATIATGPVEPDGWTLM